MYDEKVILIVSYFSLLCRSQYVKNGFRIHNNH